MIELVLLVVFVIGLSLALYKISLLSTKETSFEEAISNQHLNVIGTQIKFGKKPKEKAKKMKPKKEDVYSIQATASKSQFNQKVKESSVKEPEANHDNGVKTNSGFSLVQNEAVKPSAINVYANKSQEKKNKAKPINGSANPTLTTKNELNMSKQKESLAKENKGKHTPVASLVKVDHKPSHLIQKPDKNATTLLKTVQSLKIYGESKDKKMKSDKNSANKVMKEQQPPKNSEKSPKKPESKKTLTTDVADNRKTGVSPPVVEKNNKNQPKSKPQPETQDVNKISSKKLSQNEKKVKSVVAGEETSVAKIKDEKVKKVSNGKEELKKLMKDMQGMEMVAISADKKKKKEKLDNSVDTLSADALSQLLIMIQKSQLSGTEVQTLIDALLNKQMFLGECSDEWVEKVTKTDPVTNLKKQLEETEIKLKEQTESHQALSAKIQDLRSNLNDQISKNVNLKKQLEKSGETLQQKLDEANKQIEAQLLAKTTELKVSLEQEYQAKLIQCQHIAKEKSEAQIQQLKVNLTEMEHDLNNTKSCLEESQTQFIQKRDTLQDTETQLEYMRRSVEESQAKCHKYEEQISSFNDQLNHHNSDYENRLHALQQELASSESSLSGIMLQMQQITQERDLLQQQVRGLEEVKEVLAQNQVMLKNVLYQKSELETKLVQSDNELSKNRELLEKQRVKIELLNEEKHSLASQVIRPAAEGQENGDLHPEQKRQFLNNHHSAINEEETHSLKKEISRLKEECTKLCIRMEEEHKKCDSLSNSTKSVLIRIFPSLKSKESLEHEAFLQEAESASVATKTPPAPTTVEVVKIVEKVVQDPKLLKQLEELKEENQQLKEKVDLLSNEAASSADSKLAEELENYKEVLRNTETLLRTLQKSVEEEGKHFQKKIGLRDQEIMKLTEEKQKLLLQVDLKSYSEQTSSDDKIESELKALREALSKEETEKDALQAKYSDLEQRLESLQVNANGVPNGYACNEIKTKSTTIAE